ncbi:hypothetical protein PILCRDRAFT_64295 [Piloderma croceum F 1598]|uniref:NAD-dependent epimerase/dehydratase domain-containing protein n=1 Tax=Piloderma croceum (strain F 1598) TaxID=765440 RepID=A0A0C3CBV8_PILCF|nr:hypothetical protein PILCRDRAFT_64295 [Piloderma croceum F 1598]
MQPVLQSILVVGGNGFIGSAVCKAALARGIKVTSISSSGRPYRTPKGHTPAWVSEVKWQKANALQPETYADILPGVNGVVHTLGTLLENGQYKKAMADGDIGALISNFLSGLVDSGNPLEKGGDGTQEGYEALNRDSALRVCETFLSTPPSVQSVGPRPFVYVSAEDIFRPFISAKYIDTKREAEQHIENMIFDKLDYRGVYIRPSLVYHPHHRPITSPVAALLDLSASLHSNAPSNIPTPSRILRSLSSAFSPAEGSSLDSIANALTIPPIHVEHVAEAICAALDPAREVRGVVDVRRMRELIGWSERSRPSTTHAQS